MNYKIGLDIGIASVGWAIMLLDEKDEPIKIHKMGSRIFDEAEQPKTGESLALPRREARSMRRRLRRRRHRKERIRNLIAQYSIMNLEEIENIYKNNSGLSDIYQIRCESLDRILNREELVRLLIHFSQRRGFKSNRKADIYCSNKSSDEGKLLAAVRQNQELLIEKGYRTIGEMLCKDEKFKNVKRNKSESYENTFLRSMIVDEMNLIFEKQKELGNEFLSDDFCAQYIEILCSQRSFDEGPGGNSIYGGNQIEKMLGFCTFERDERRAFKAQYSFELFSLLQKINSIKIRKGGEKYSLNDEQKEKVRTFCFEHSSVNYHQLRKLISLSEDEFFNISYGNEGREKTEKKTKFEYLKAYHKIKNAYKGVDDSLTKEKLNVIGYALSAYKNDEKINDYLKGKGFAENEIEAALSLQSFSGTGNLSVKACDKIIPFLEQGMLYNEACEAAGYSFKADNQCKRTMYLPANSEQAPELDDIKNPVVRRAVSQTIKVVNGIIREMEASPSFISVEVANEISKNFSDRKNQEKEMDENAKRNDKIKKEIEELGVHDPKGIDIVKYKLWEDQDGRCLYSGASIPIGRLFEPGFAEVDHIIPYSISFDDRYSNKALVLTHENREKGNRLPLEYLKGEKRDSFLVRVNNLPYSKRKLNLLKEIYTGEERNSFKERNLNDTRYISRFIYNFIRDHLLFAESNTDRKETVLCVSGAVTSYIRKRWGISKIRENGDVHHAIDAVVIACVTRGMINRITEYSKRHELYEDVIHRDEVDLKTGEYINRFPTPYTDFKNELEMRTSDDPMSRFAAPLSGYLPGEEIKPIFVSRMPHRKISGQAHKETAQRERTAEDGTKYLIKKVSLTELKLDKNGEIDGYYNPSSDVLLYNALKQRLIAFDGDAKKAFEEPFYKPKSDGSQGPIVKKVKIEKKSTLNVSVQEEKAKAENGSMIRADIFCKDGKYFIVPIYVSDVVEPSLPNKAVTRGKQYSEWLEMDDKDFIFSLYPNDLIKVTSVSECVFSLVNDKSTLPPKTSAREFFVYYKNASISTASITVINHDNTYKISSLGVKTLQKIEKYQVDVLGNYHKVKKEKRQYFR